MLQRSLALASRCRSDSRDPAKIYILFLLHFYVRQAVTTCKPQTGCGGAGAARAAALGRVGEQAQCQRAQHLERRAALARVRRAARALQLADQVRLDQGLTIRV